MSRKPAGARGLTFDDVAEMGARLPGLAEELSYRTRGLKVKGKLVARLKEDGETLVIRTSFFDRDQLMHTEPKTFFLTDHYHDYPYVLVSLPRVRHAQMAELLEDAWRRVAPKRLIAELDASRAE